MANRYKMFLAAFLLMVFLADAAYAANLGTLAEEEYAQLERGGEAVFSILFWTSDVQPFDVSMSIKEKPEGWTVTFEPQKFSLPADVSRRSIYLPSRGYTNAFVETVRVSPPTGAPQGSYAIVVSAKAGGSSSGISVNQERIFRLTAEVGGSGGAGAPVQKQAASQNTANETANKTSALKQGNENDESGKRNANVSGTPASWGDDITGRVISFARAQAMILAFAIALILYISWKIYRKP